MTLHIKNMVCPRCAMIVTQILERRGLSPVSVSIGRAETAGNIGAADLAALAAELESVGFELVTDGAEQAVVGIKAVVDEAVYTPRLVTSTLSALIAERLGTDYTSLSRTFSAHEGQTIEAYAIGRRVERAQLLLATSEVSVKELAFALGYSSAAHFSRQFKQVTGMTPSEYVLKRKARESKTPHQ